MKQSHLMSKSRRQAPKDELANNAKLLIRAGFIHKEMAGVYDWLPLGLRVLKKSVELIRREMNAVGGQELELSALQKPEVWQKSGRWDDEVVDDWFKPELKNGSRLGLAFTHEEPLTDLMREQVASYRDLPLYIYQFQTKFRNELRAKSGLLRGREFLMKDLYDFSLDRETHLRFYEQMQGVYKRVYHRFGLGDQTYMTASSGGSFSKYSFEFQTICQAGEDVIYYDEEKRFAVNQADYSPELLADFGLREKDCNFKEAKSIEVGDIYTLGEKYAQAIGLTYKDQQGRVRPVFMGSYGIGVPRVIGAVVELLADDQGLSWPVTIAPYELHLIQLGQNEAVKKTAVELYGALSEAGVEVLYDDRQTAAGEKFAEADLIGIPYQLIVSEKNVIAGELEVKDRRTGRVTNIDEGQIVDGVLKLLTRLKADLNPDQE